jgi:hypothetical protein
MELKKIILGPEELKKLIDFMHSRENSGDQRRGDLGTRLESSFYIQSVLPKIETSPGHSVADYEVSIGILVRPTRKHLARLTNLLVELYDDTIAGSVVQT